MEPSSRLYSLKQQSALSVSLGKLHTWRGTEPETAQVLTLPMSQNMTFSAVLRSALLHTRLRAFR